MARPKEFDRNRALDKAVQVFWCKGYEATSIQDLVDGMGINRQSIYDTFGDKHSLFLQALQHYEGIEGAKVLEALQQPGSAKAAIRRAFELVVEKPAQERQLGCLMVNTTVELANEQDQEVAKLVKNSLEQNQVLFHQTLIKAQQQGEISASQDLRALARFLANSLVGLRVTTKAVTDTKTLQDILDITLSVLK